MGQKLETYIGAAQFYAQERGLVNAPLVPLGNCTKATFSWQTSDKKLMDMQSLAGGTFDHVSLIEGGELDLEISQLKKDNLMEAVDIKQLDTFNAALLFAKTEGIIPAPESSHAIAAAINEALVCKEEGKQKTILFNLSGHGLIDMAAYDQYLSGDLSNHELSDDEIGKNLNELEHLI